MVRNTKGLHGRIVILYDLGEGDAPEVDNVYTAVITVKNTGTKEITKRDFDGPLTFNMPPPAKILSAAVGDCKPGELRRHMDFDLSSTQQAITIAPILLNSNDLISFSLVLSDVTDPEMLNKKVVCETRISGVTRVARETDLNTMPLLRRYLTVAALIPIASYVAVLVLARIPSAVVGLGLMALCYGLGLPLFALLRRRSSS